MRSARRSSCRTSRRTPATSCCSSRRRGRRSRRSCSCTSSRRSSSAGIGPDELTGERIEVVSGSIFANLVAGFIIIATARDAVSPRRPQRVDGCAGREGAGAVRRALRRGAVRGRPARREPARRGDPAGDGGVRHLGDVRLRAWRVADATRGAGVRRRRHGAGHHRRRRRDDPRHPRIPSAGRRAGGQRDPAADHAVLRVAAVGERAS